MKGRWLKFAEGSGGQKPVFAADAVAKRDRVPVLVCVIKISGSSVAGQEECECVRMSERLQDGDVCCGNVACLDDVFVRRHQECLVDAGSVDRGHCSVRFGSVWRCESEEGPAT